MPHLDLAEPGDKAGIGVLIKTATTRHRMPPTLPRRANLAAVALDLDRNGRLTGVEIFNARTRLPPDALAAAEHLD